MSVLYTYSNIVKLEIKDDKHVINVYPNPAKDLLNITMPSIATGKMNAIITDLHGKILIDKK